MVNYPTLTLAQLALLKEAVDRAEHEKGSLMPEDWPEFEKTITAMRNAVRQAGIDRTNLRVIITQHGGTVTDG